MSVRLEELDRPARSVLFLSKDESKPDLQRAFHGFLDIPQRLILRPPLADCARDFWCFRNNPALLAPRQMNEEPNYPLTHFSSLTIWISFEILMKGVYTCAGQT